MKNVVDGKTIPPKADKLLVLGRERFQNYIMSAGDYLELDDLADQQSRSSTTSNSSCSIVPSDEYFDPIALLQDLENSNNEWQQGNNSSTRFSTASVRPLEVALPPATSGPLVCDTERQSPTSVSKLPSFSVIETKFLNERAADDPVKGKAEPKIEGPSRPLDMVASSSSPKTFPNGKKKDSAAQKKEAKKISVSCRSKL